MEDNVNNLRSSAPGWKQEERFFLLHLEILQSCFGLWSVTETLNCPEVWIWVWLSVSLCQPCDDWQPHQQSPPGLGVWWDNPLWLCMQINGQTTSEISSPQWHRMLHQKCTESPTTDQMSHNNTPIHRMYFCTCLNLCCHTAASGNPQIFPTVALTLS